VFNREDGDAPHVDLAAEKQHGDFIRANAEWIDACTDLSDGGLALAAFEMAEAADCGVTLDADDTPTLFKAGVPIATVGKFGGMDITMGASTAPLSDLAATYRATFADTFA